MPIHVNLLLNSSKVFWFLLDVLYIHFNAMDNSLYSLFLDVTSKLSLFIMMRQAD